MSYFVYILRSSKTHRYYIGHTGNVTQRVAIHNRGKVKSTKAGIPWVVVREEGYSTRQEAYRREKQIKRYKHGEAFNKLILVGA